MMQLKLLVTSEQATEAREPVAAAVRSTSAGVVAVEDAAAGDVVAEKLGENFRGS